MTLPPSIPNVIVIAGPTASGKSTLALALADAFGGVIVNADSQQCYRDLPTLTARPSAADEARAPHRLFGTLGPLEDDSAPAWASRAAQEIVAAAQAGKRAIVVGGTGLYLQALMVGMPAMPAIAAEARTRAKAMLDEIGHAALHARLAERDPVLGAKLKTGDTQRLLRAWEVVEATGRPLSAWQTDPPIAPIAAQYHAIALLAPRDDANEAIDARFDAMMAAGAMNEVAALVATGVPRTAPIMRVLGARPLADHLAGALGREEAVAQAKTATRQYAKRQRTWFRHHFPASLTIHEQFSERLLPEIFAKIREWG